MKVFLLLMWMSVAANGNKSHDVNNFAEFEKAAKKDDTVKLFL